jgi:sterol desaturase/sphingolipid hydroxylase (fatty acid hydroxylase superfamily)
VCQGCPGQERTTHGLQKKKQKQKAPRVYLWITKASRKTRKINEENEFKNKRELEQTQPWRALHQNQPHKAIVVTSVVFKVIIMMEMIMTVMMLVTLMIMVTMIMMVVVVVVVVVVMVVAVTVIVVVVLGYRAYDEFCPRAPPHGASLVHPCPPLR